MYASPHLFPYRLADYYEHVYASCPVMLPANNLSTLAFHLSEDGPSHLLSAISAVLALRLQSNAWRTLKTHSPWAATSDSDDGYQAPPLASAPANSIAAYHARTSLHLIKRHAKEQTARTAASNTSLNSSGRPPSRNSTDAEVAQIEIVASFTLLSHYYYGSGQHRRANACAAQAWSDAQSLSIQALGSSGFGIGSGGVNVEASPSWFSQLQKQEWSRRVYWLSYCAVTVMSCTGGFVSGFHLSTVAIR